MAVFFRLKTACSSVWPESSPWKRDVTGSNPVTQTKLNIVDGSLSAAKGQIGREAYGVIRDLE